MLDTMFSTRKPWRKSSMYNVNDIMASGKRVKNLFSHQDEPWHSVAIRPVRPYYTMTRVRQLEPSVDLMLRLLVDKLQERFVGTEQPFDLAVYLSYFAWDTMFQITFSRNLGMVASGRDRGSFLETSTKSLDYFASVSQMPILDFLLDKNPVVRIGPPLFKWAADFSTRAFHERKTEIPRSSKSCTDFLDWFLEAQKKSPDLVDDDMITVYLLSNVLAGSDTTAATMCSAIFYTLKHPVVNQEQIKHLPYLDAVMREAMRIHPGVGLMLEREVPAEGFVCEGHFLPAGTIVGANPWVVNRVASVFGDRPDEFDPDRWRPQRGETDRAYVHRRKKMDRVDLTFGAESRVCLGKDISRLESYKLVATIFSTFDLALADPAITWKVTNSWFVRQENIPVRLAPAPPE